jgi:hypothetical protein
MAVYKIFPTKDASIYTISQSMNTGLDEIVEASTTIAETLPQVSRYLMHFSNTEITNMLGSDFTTGGKIGIGSEYSVFLKNSAAVVNGLQLDQVLEVYPVSGSWGMGTGKYYNTPITTNGVSWEWRTYSGSDAGALKWNISGASGSAVTSSYSSSAIGGGNWYTASATDSLVASQTFSYGNSTDLNIDVTNIVKNWHSHSIDPLMGIGNDGFIIKQQSSREFVPNKATTATFRYFSIDTNTIYPPQLEFRWKDVSFDTGSSNNTILNNPESFISIYNNDGTYYSESVARFRIAAIPKYPDVVFQTASLYTTNYYLPPTSSLYAIKDTDTNEFVIEFDNTYTQISADGVSSYFDVYMNGLEPERYYTILIQTELSNGVQVFDEDIMFKVVNG